MGLDTIYPFIEVFLECPVVVSNFLVEVKMFRIVIITGVNRCGMSSVRYFYDSIHKERRE